MQKTYLFIYRNEFKEKQKIKLNKFKQKKIKGGVTSSSSPDNSDLPEPLKLLKPLPSIKNR